MKEKLIFVATTPLVLIGLWIMVGLRLQLVNKNIKNFIVDGRPNRGNN